MKKRPTIALHMIMKNEAHNIGPLMSSIEGCFDAIYITDTGSTDGTVEILKDPKTEEVACAPIHVSHFDWVNDFGKARQYALDQVPADYDYVMWLDADDVLSDKDKFIHWRDHTMHCAHFWLANYNYAYDDQGNPVCTFFRERVVKHKHCFKWKYFIHEGLVSDHSKKVDTQFTSAWTVNHRRTKDDEKADRARNIKVFEQKIAEGEEMSARLTYYYGKELHDAGQYLKAKTVLEDVATYGPESSLEPHDRVMAQQYLSMTYARCGKWHQSLNTALNGLQLEPNRAEFLILVADALVNIGKQREALLYYEAAKHGSLTSSGGALFTSPHARTLYPLQRQVEIYLGMGDYKSALVEIENLKSHGVKVPALESKAMEMKQKDRQPTKDDLVEVRDIVITTPPMTLIKDWDERTLENKGLGGSETAAVEVARLLHKETGRPVKVFMSRKTADVMPSGVEYLPIEQLEGYFTKYLPAAHIAWRHASNLTPAPTYIWSHDLVTPGADALLNHKDNAKLWCLTEFHKHFCVDMQGIDESRIDLVANGIEPKLFDDDAPKNENKVIFSSSPDRGWERSIEICKRARQEVPDLELHLFYGTQNMRQMGHIEEAERLDKLVSDNRDFVHFHGFVDKQCLTQHFKEASVWLYPADFIETSCITAMEALCAGTYPLVRNMGALRYTLKEAYDSGMCTILDQDAVCDEDYDVWADELVYHLKEKSFQRVRVDRHSYSWAARIKDYIKSMGL